MKIVFPRPDASGSLTERAVDISRCEYSRRPSSALLSRSGTYFVVVVCMLVLYVCRRGPCTWNLHVTGPAASSSGL